MSKFRISLSLAVLSVLMTIPSRAVASELNTAESDKVLNNTFNQISNSNVAETAISVDEKRFSLDDASRMLESQQETVSYKAADLQPQVNNSIASRPVDLDELCKSFPYNSRCQDRTKPAAPTEGSKPAPEANEQSQSESAAKTSGLAITPEISTLGLGASVTKSLTPNLNARVGVNAFSYGIDLEETDVKYEGDLNLLNVSTLVDYHPFKNSGLRLTGGVVFNNNKLEANARAKNNQQFEFNGNTYNTSQIGSANAKVSLPNSVAPYLGIGWGNAVRPGNRLSFAVNLGVMFAGSPNVDVTANIDPSVPAATREQILRDVKAEERQLEKDLEGYNIYPVLSVGVSYQF